MAPWLLSELPYGLMGVWVGLPGLLQGLVTVACLAVPVAYSALVLCRSEAARALQAARQHMVCFAVDTQASLVAAGEKPTVTPAMLQQWVEQLQEVAARNGDQLCGAVAERCRGALALRGYYLPHTVRVRGITQAQQARFQSGW